MRLRRLPALIALIISTTALLLSISVCVADLRVVSGGTQNILRYDENTGAFLEVFVPAGSGGLELPFGLAFGPDGNLYVTSSNALAGGLGKVLRYDGSTGSFVAVFVPSGSGGLFLPSGLTFGPDCSLYVTSGTENGGGGQVLRYQGGTGGFVDAFVPSGSGGLVHARSLVFGSDDNLYVTDFETSRVLRYSGTTGAFLGAFVPAGSGGLAVPTGLVFGPDGNLYVASGNRVLRYDGSTGAFIDQFVSPESGGLNGAQDLAFGPDGDLYVTKGPIFDSGPEAVLRYDGTTGAFVEVFIPENSGGLLIPLSLAFRPVSATSHVDSVMVAVGNLRLPSGTGNSLNASLEGARAAIDQGRLIPAGNRLHAFTKRSKPTRAS